MAQVLVNESSLEDIADAIREKNGSSDTYQPAQMAEAIRSIETSMKKTTTSVSCTLAVGAFTTIEINASGTQSGEMPIGTYYVNDTASTSGNEPIGLVISSVIYSGARYYVTFYNAHATRSLTMIGTLTTFWSS